MQGRECVDETFDASQCGSYDLLAQASEEGFALAVLERTRKKFIAVATFPISVPTPDDWSSAVDGLRSAFPWVGAEFRKVVLGFRSRKFTLLPSGLFKPEHAKRFLASAALVDDLDEVRFFEPAAGVTMIHALPTQLTCAWNTLHPRTVFMHADGALLTPAMDRQRGTQLLLVVEGAFATLIVTSAARLLAMLPLEVRAAEDALYHCLAVMQGLSISPQEVAVKVIGQGVASPCDSDPRATVQVRATDIKLLLGRYLKRGDARDSLSGYEYSYTVDKVRGEFSSLFHLAECV